MQRELLEKHVTAFYMKQRRCLPPSPVSGSARQIIHSHLSRTYTQNNQPLHSVEIEQLLKWTNHKPSGVALMGIGNRFESLTFQVDRDTGLSTEGRSLGIGLRSCDDLTMAIDTRSLVLQMMASSTCGEISFCPIAAVLWS